MSINDATVQKDFYNVDREGLEPDAFERVLSGIEREAAAALARTLDETQWPPTAEDRHMLSTWIALQFLRSAATRHSGEEMYRSVAKLEVGTFTTDQVRQRLRLERDVPDEEVERLRARLLRTADVFEVDHHRHLQTIIEALQGATNLVFFRQPWVLTRFNLKSLGTSDTPIVLIPDPKDRVIGLGTGLGNAMQLYVPLSRRVGLCMGALGDRVPDFIIPGTASMAKQLNDYTLWNARKIVFHHPDDTPYADRTIPQPRGQEMDVPHEQINKIIESFARRQGRASGLP